MDSVYTEESVAQQWKNNINSTKLLSTEREKEKERVSEKALKSLEWANEFMFHILNRMPEIKRE